MAEQWTVLEVANKVDEWTSGYGNKMRSYRVNLKSASGEEKVNVEWARREDSPLPQAGQVILIERFEERANHGTKLHLARTGQGGSSGPEDPKRAARIVRQHSQDMALRAMALRVAPEKLHEMEAEEFMKLIRQLADWFDNDAKKAGDAA